MFNCIFLLGSVTQVMKAKHLLNTYSLPVYATKVSTEKRGCIHGIEFACNYKKNIANILQKNGIKFEEFNRDIS